MLSFLVKIKNEETSITIDLAIWWSRFIGQISVVLITVFKKEENGGKKGIKHNIMYTVASKSNWCANFCFCIFFFSEILFFGVITTYFNTCTCRSSCDCWQLQCKSCTWQKRKENNFLKKSCVVSEIRYEFFFNFYSLFFDQLIFFLWKWTSTKEGQQNIYRIEFRLLFRLGMGKTWFKTDHCLLDLILDVKWILCMCS